MSKNLLLLSMVILSGGVVLFLLQTSSQESLVQSQKHMMLSNSSLQTLSSKISSKINIKNNKNVKEIDNNIVQVKQQERGSNNKAIQEISSESTKSSLTSTSSHSSMQENRDMISNTYYEPTIKDYKQFYGNKISNYKSPQRIKEELPPPPPQ